MLHNPLRIPPRHPVEHGLVLYMPFEKLCINKAIDFSMYGNHGTLYNATWADGRFGKAVYLNGVNSYVEVPDSESLHVAPPFTVALWVHPTADKAWVPIYKGAWGSDNSWYVSSGDVYYLNASYWYGGNRYGAGVSYNFLNKWTFVTVVYSAPGSPILFYINGVLAATGSVMPTGVSYNTRRLWIGRYETSDYYVQGYEDEVYLFKRPLSGSEVRRLYEAGRPWRIV